MKTSDTLKYIAAFIAAAATASASGQTLSTEITVDRTITPVETSAAPLGTVRPSVLRPSALGTSLSISEFDGSVLYPASVFETAPSLSDGLPEPSPYRGYATLGYFPVYNLGAQVGYRLIDNSRTLLGASAGFGGQSWNAHGVERSMTMSDNAIGVQAHLRQHFGAHRLEVKADYTHTALKSPSVRFDEQTQAFNSFRASASFGRAAVRYSYRIAAAVDRLGASKPVLGYSRSYEASANTLVKGSLSGAYYSSDGRIGGELAVDASHMHRSGTEVYPLAVLAYTAPKYSGTTVATVTPAFVYRSPSLRLRLGLALDIVDSADCSNLAVRPAVSASWTPTGRFAAYVRADGGTDFNSLRRRFDYSPFVNPFAVSELRRTPVRAELGLHYGGTGGFRAGFSAGYTVTDGAAMPVASTVVCFLPVDLKLLWAKLSLGYKFDWMNLDISANARFNQGGFAHADPDSPDRARFVADIAAKARPIEPLAVGIGWELRASRSCYTAAALGGDTDARLNLSNVSDLHLDATYAFSDRLSAGLEVRNMLCRRPEILPGLPMPGLHGLLSATIRF